MFDSSIKKEDVIVIEYHAKVDIKRNTRMSPIHKESLKEEPKKLQEILCFFTCYSLYLQERLQNIWRGI